MRWAVVVRALAVLLGGALGGALAIAALFVAGRIGGPLLSSSVAWLLATPGAYVVSWLSGWPLEQEAGLVCYALGALATAALGGALTGALLGALATGARGDADRRGAAPRPRSADLARRMLPSRACALVITSAPWHSCSRSGSRATSRKGSRPERS